MTATAPRVAGTRGGDDPNPGDAFAVWLLAIGQTLGFAALFYVFGALVVPLETETGWSKAELALGPTATLIVSALASPMMGRLVDRGRGIHLLVGGAVLGGVLLLVLSAVTTQRIWVIVWALIGLAHAASLYDVCFAFLTRRLGDGARAAIIKVTLVAGFASSLAFPLGAFVAADWGWRGALVVFAALQLVVTAPMNWYAGARLRRRAVRVEPSSRAAKGDIAGVLRRLDFWLICAIFSLGMLNHSILVTYFIPVFTGLGASPALAVIAASCVGPAQFVGRFLLMLGQTRITAVAATLVAATGIVCASVALFAAGVSTWLIFAFAVCQGAAVGMLSILRPVLAVEVLGRRNVGAVFGMIAVGPLLASAAAPLAGAFLQGLGGPQGLVLGTFIIAVLALAFTVALKFRIR